MIADCCVGCGVGSVLRHSCAGRHKRAGTPIGLVDACPAPSGGVLLESDGRFSEAGRRRLRAADVRGTNGGSGRGNGHPTGLGGSVVALCPWLGTAPQSRAEARCGEAKAQPRSSSSTLDTTPKFSSSPNPPVRPGRVPGWGPGYRELRSCGPSRPADRPIPTLSRCAARLFGLAPAP